MAKVKYYGSSKTLGHGMQTEFVRKGNSVTTWSAYGSSVTRNTKTNRLTMQLPDSFKHLQREKRFRGQAGLARLKEMGRNSRVHTFDAFHSYEPHIDNKGSDWGNRFILYRDAVRVQATTGSSGG